MPRFSSRWRRFPPRARRAVTAAVSDGDARRVRGDGRRRGDRDHRRAAVEERHEPRRRPVPDPLTMTPYGKDLLGGPDAYFVFGYVHVVADIRAGASGGNLNANYSSPREQKDGAILVEHFAAKPLLERARRHDRRLVSRRDGLHDGGAAAAEPRSDRADRRARGPLPRRRVPRGHPVAVLGAQYIALQQNGTGLLSGPLDQTTSRRRSRPSSGTSLPNRSSGTT